MAENKEMFIIPSEENDYTDVTTEYTGEEVELSKQVMGRLYKKHILSKGSFLHPRTKNKVTIDDDFMDKMVTNFHAGVVKDVSVPLAGKNNEHTWEPERNAGAVVDLQKEGDKLYAYVDVRKKDIENDFGRTITGISAMFDSRHTDTKTGEEHGPTLLHACATNYGYLNDLEPYQEIVAATADYQNSVILLSASEEDDDSDVSKEEIEMPKATLEELMKQLKEEFNIDVKALQTDSSVKDEKEKELEDATALTNTLTEEVAKSGTRVEELESTIKQMQEKLVNSGVVSLSNGETFTPEDMVEALGSVVNTQVQLTNQVNELLEDKKKAEHDKAYAEVLALSRDGFVEPEAVEDMTEIKLTNPERFNRLLPKRPRVEMKEESGFVPENSDQEENVNDYIAELTARHSNIYGKRN